ncbi:hypothetical protein B0H13DRAFT_2501481 [Mycena leptocephala]|nr:hypothetical protein B0H13DRAFT_2501481 [Mycena leptocephala]
MPLALSPSITVCADRHRGLFPSRSLSFLLSFHLHPKIITSIFTCETPSNTKDRTATPSNRSLSTSNSLAVPFLVTSTRASPHLLATLACHRLHKPPRLYDCMHAPLQYQTPLQMRPAPSTAYTQPPAATSPSTPSGDTAHPPERVHPAARDPAVVLHIGDGHFSCHLDIQMIHRAPSSVAPVTLPRSLRPSPSSPRVLRPTSRSIAHLTVVHPSHHDDLVVIAFAFAREGQGAAPTGPVPPPPPLSVAPQRVFLIPCTPRLASPPFYFLVDPTTHVLLVAVVLVSYELMSTFFSCILSPMHEFRLRGVLLQVKEIQITKKRLRADHWLCRPTFTTFSFTTPGNSKNIAEFQQLSRSPRETLDQTTDRRLHSHGVRGFLRIPD